MRLRSFYAYRLRAAIENTLDSVSTLKTAEFQTAAGHFAYRHIKPALFWGYSLETYHESRLKIADPAKTLLDYFYFNPKVNSTDDFIELRLNIFELQQKLDMEKFDQYLDLFDSDALRIRARKFIQFVENHADAA